MAAIDFILGTFRSLGSLPMVKNLIGVELEGERGRRMRGKIRYSSVRQSNSPSNSTPIKFFDHYETT